MFTKGFIQFVGDFYSKLQEISIFQVAYTITYFTISLIIFFIGTTLSAAVPSL